MRGAVELPLVAVEQVLDVVAAALRAVQLLLVRVAAHLGAIDRRRCGGSFRTSLVKLRSSSGSSPRPSSRARAVSSSP